MHDTLTGSTPKLTTNKSEMFSAAPRGSVFLYGLAIFTSALLLFQIQPLIAKIILPWFGGAAAVWVVCLVFFQTGLLLGYSYAHFLTRRFPPAKQFVLHTVVLAVSLISLPILPKAYWRPSGPDNPALHILLLLTATVGLPYFALSSTSPLLQAWFSDLRNSTSSSTYRFYALSNAGSLLALISYPLFVEPHLSTSHQALGWSGAYAALVALLVVLAFGSRKRASSRASALSPDAESNAATRPDRKTQSLWIALAACGSALLLAVTNHITQNIASVPLLWIIPLCLYLLSFILCFESDRWYPRNLFLRFLGIALGGMTYALSPSFAGLPVKVLLPLYCAGLFVCCMFCHGELARRKPGPEYLTHFYLSCALGGALGAAFVALLAPHIFSGYYELECGLAACAVLVLLVHYKDPESAFYKEGWHPAWMVMIGLVIAIAVGLASTVQEQQGNAKLSVRNFYGVLRVVDEPGKQAAQGNGQAPANEPTGPYRVLMNGTIKHGLEFRDAARELEPTSYFSRRSGVGVAIIAAQSRGPLHVGVIGLGAGTIAAYGRRGDHYTFYEINPLDVQIAHTQFHFLSSSPADVQIVLGDARLSLEQNTLQGFDVFAVDAFSGDSIPVHLITREAFQLYFRELKPGGILAVHISNNYLNLEPVVRAAAASLGKEAVLVSNSDDHPNGIYAASWILVADASTFAALPDIEEDGRVLAPAGGSNLWTDDYSSLFPLLK
jgi:hypothetical protein